MEVKCLARERGDISLKQYTHTQFEVFTDLMSLLFIIYLLECIHAIVLKSTSDMMFVHVICNSISQSSHANYEITLLSLKPATSKGRSFNEFEETTFCTSSGLESKPRPNGRDIDMAGRASRVLEMTAVARL